MEFFFNPATGRVEQRQVDNNLPFRSMTDMASEINQFPFLSPNPITPLDPFKNTVPVMSATTSTGYGELSLHDYLELPTKIPRPSR